MLGVDELQSSFEQRRMILTAALALGAMAVGGTTAAAGHTRENHGDHDRRHGGGGGHTTQVYTLSAPEHGNPDGRRLRRAQRDVLRLERH